MLLELGREVHFSSVLFRGGGGRGRLDLKFKGENFMGYARYKNGLGYA